MEAWCYIFYDTYVHLPISALFVLEPTSMRSLLDVTKTVTTRLVLALVRKIVQYPEQDNFRIALPIIIDLVERFAHTGHDRQIMTFFRALAHCLAT